jgi:hypothetical protein
MVASQAGERREGAEMKSFDRSSLARALMTGVASLAFMMVSAGGVRAEIVTVQGEDGAAGTDGVNQGDNGMPGDDGESVSANAGSTQPITVPLNKATATGGNGGVGGNAALFGTGGVGGNGGAANATAATTITFGAAEADANSSGGTGGPGGLEVLGIDGNSGNGGGATATSAAVNADGSPVASNANATGGAGGSGGSAVSGANGGPGKLVLFRRPRAGVVNTDVVAGEADYVPLVDRVCVLSRTPQLGRARDEDMDCSQPRGRDQSPQEPSPCGRMGSMVRRRNRRDEGVGRIIRDRCLRRASERERRGVAKWTRRTSAAGRREVQRTLG